MLCLPVQSIFAVVYMNYLYIYTFSGGMQSLHFADGLLRFDSPAAWNGFNKSI